MPQNYHCTLAYPSTQSKHFQLWRQLPDAPSSFLAVPCFVGGEKSKTAECVASRACKNRDILCDKDLLSSHNRPKTQAVTECSICEVFHSA